MLNIAPALYGQSKKYIELWLHVFDKMNDGQYTFAVSELIEDVSLTRQSLSIIIKRGVEVFNAKGISLAVYRKYDTDRYLTVSVDGLKTIKVQPKVAVSTKPKKEKVDNNTDQLSLATNIIITYLNEKTGKQYKVDTPATVQLIKARMKSGFTIEQFKYVVDVKSAHWMNTDMEKYLRPETLFGNKFEGYLNETFTNNRQSIAFRNAEESIKRDW